MMRNLQYALEKSQLRSCNRKAEYHPQTILPCQICLRVAISTILSSHVIVEEEPVSYQEGMSCSEIFLALQGIPYIIYPRNSLSIA